MWLLYILKLKGCGVQAALKSLGLGNVNYAFIEEGSQAEGKGGGNRAEENHLKASTSIIFCVSCAGQVSYSQGACRKTLLSHRKLQVLNLSVSTELFVWCYFFFLMLVKCDFKRIY